MQRPPTPTTHAQQIEREVYERFFRNQGDLMRRLDEQEAQRLRERQRKEEIRLKSKGEVIKHPNNGHLWMHLAGFIDGDSQPDLDAIEMRQREREMRRQQMAVQHQQQSNDTYGESQQDENSHKRSNKQQQKIPWKLMRQLRRQQVQQNRARLQKMRENQAHKMSHYHKY